MGFEPPSVRVRARFDGTVFVPVGPVDLPLGTIIEAWPETLRKPRNPQFDNAKGRVRMADDFDEIPEGFEDYV
ncbi:hypothetical protein BH11ARM2_BH11ARM2_23510 [soil metagenome]